MVPAVVATVVLLLAGCGVLDQGLSAPARPGDASTTATDGPTSAPSAGVRASATAATDTEAAVGDGHDVARDDPATADGAAADETEEAGNRVSGDGTGQSQETAYEGTAGRDQRSSGRNGSDGRAGSGDGAADDTVSRTLRRGDRGGAVRRLQRRLADLHYWLGPIDGVYGHLTEQAVFAFQGVEGLAIDGIVGPRTRAALADATPPTARSDSGSLIEVDEEARVVLDVRGGEVRWAWHTSTGTNQDYEHPAGHTALAETPDGRHTIDWQVDGWRENELGRLWRPKYFHADGIALHGFASVPATPSSHGCVRLSLPAMNFIWANDIAPKGSTVWVYGRAP